MHTVTKNPSTFALFLGYPSHLPIIDYPTSVSNLIDITYDIYNHSPFFTQKRRGGRVVSKSLLLAYGRLGVRIPATTARHSRKNRYLQLHCSTLGNRCIKCYGSSEMSSKRMSCVTVGAIRFPIMSDEHTLQRFAGNGDVSI